MSVPYQDRLAVLQSVLQKLKHSDEREQLLNNIAHLKVTAYLLTPTRTKTHPNHADKSRFFKPTDEPASQFEEVLKQTEERVALLIPPTDIDNTDTKVKHFREDLYKAYEAKRDDNDIALDSFVSAISDKYQTADIKRGI